MKSSINENNLYNQNFRGAYCTCSRPYPDPDDSVEDEMIQCIICEDWYHTRVSVGVSTSISRLPVNFELKYWFGVSDI